MEVEKIFKKRFISVIQLCSSIATKNKTTTKGLGCLMPLPTIFRLYHGSQFYWWRKPEYQEKTINLPQLTDTLSHNVASSTPRLSGIRTHNVSGDRH